MTEQANIRWGWLKFLYVYNVLTLIPSGLVIIVFPLLVKTMFRMPEQDPYIFGITGSVWLSFGILSIFGLKYPLRFTPVLLMQLCYKTLWLLGIVLPAAVRGAQPVYAKLLVLAMLSYMILDLISIPFSHLLHNDLMDEPGREKRRHT